MTRDPPGYGQAGGGQAAGLIDWLVLGLCLMADSGGNGNRSGGGGEVGGVDPPTSSCRCSPQAGKSGR